MLRSPLLHFLLLGSLLFALQTAWSSVPETPVVEVQRSVIEESVAAYRTQMGRPPTESERDALENQAIENAIWLEQAHTLGLPQIDSVVHQRLILNMRFLEGETDASDEELLARAFELGMDKSDTVVQRRLIDRVQAIVRARVRAREIDAATLEAYFEETAERWREPALLDLTHVYFSRDKRGGDTGTDAGSALARLLDASDTPNAPNVSKAPEDALALGDPFLAGHRLRGATPNRIVARLGPDFAAGVENAPVEEWVGPVPSAFGMHLVWIHRRAESRIPDLAEVESRVREDWIEAESRKALREQVTRRRAQVDLRILEDAPPAAAN
ncbi:MAG: peptidyl-prolyl cis-trans isomerase [Myxococcota bacterium]